MSKLEQLINELCPDGVEYFAVSTLIKTKTIKTVAPSFKIKRNFYAVEGTTPIISQESEYISGYCDRKDKNIPVDEYVCFGDHSEHIKYVDFSFVQGADGLKIMKVIDKDILIPRYFYHAVLNFYLKHNNYERHFKYFTDTYIPLPPLPIQREIVRILDNFTLLSAELSEELSAELTARKQQYEYYRDYLLSFDDEDVEKVIPDIDCSNVKIVKLCEIAEIGTGSHNTNEGLTEGIYPFYVRSQEPLKMNTYEFDETAIITAGDGVGVGKVYHFVNGKYALHQRAYRIHPISDSVNPKYLFYWFQTKFLHYIQKSMYQSSVASIRRPMLNNFEVLIPSIETQNNIVKILDRFDMLCNGISEGIPAEIEARKQQYEYYRDTLLSFNQEQCSQIVNVERERESKTQ